LAVYFSGANPAIRFNLLPAKEASKRISTTIGARAFGIKKVFCFLQGFQNLVGIIFKI
jgi:hypothetical protein